MNRTTKHIFALVFLVSLLFPSSAFAGNGPIPVPTIREGQYVYSPDNCAPKGMSGVQQRELNGRLKNLHNPFYVVVLCNLPKLGSSHLEYARSNGFRGDSETKRIEVATAMLMEDWADEQPDAYDVTNSGVFVIAFKPRKFAWHPSLRAKNELGLNKRQQDPFTQKFVRAAKQRPADYAAGIGNLATAYDDWYYDRTDPVRIAQRAEAERQRQERRRLQAAQAELDAEILHLSDLLSEKDYLPADSDSYREALQKAKAVRATDDPAKMHDEAAQLKGSVEVLDNYVSEKKTEATLAMVAFILKWFLILSVVGFIIYLLRRRRATQLELIDQWTSIVSGWDIRVRNAHGKWTDHYLEREDIVGLDGVTGATKELWDETTKKVDDLLVRIRAMQAHQSNCEKIYKRGSYFNFEPYHQAVKAFQEPFEFDTGKVNEADLFGGETVTVTVTPANFVADTGALFTSSIDGWKRLQRAAEERYGNDAEGDFPHDNMDLLFRITAQYEIPERWIDHHPLYGDDESDAAVYEKLDALRLNDPITYVLRLEEMLAEEQDILQQINRLVDLREKIARVRVTDSFDLKDTHVRAEDDPDMTLAAAREAEDKLAGLLAAGTEEQVTKQADEVVRLYEKTAQQRAEIVSAVKGVEGAIESAKAAGQAAYRAVTKATEATNEAAKIHVRSRISHARDSIAVAERFIREGTEIVEKAEATFKKARHLDARRLVDEAKAAFKTAVERSAGASEHCVQLARDKAAYESKLASLDRTRRSLANKMNGYGSHARKLDAVNRPTISGLADYTALILVLDQQINGWRSSVRKAESDYEEEQRRIRRAREKKEREERERRARERRRRSSYSSSSYGGGYSGGFGGGGFGGSSGGFGGGGFGGSSGSF